MQTSSFFSKAKLLLPAAAFLAAAFGTSSVYIAKHRGHAELQKSAELKKASNEAFSLERLGTGLRALEAAVRRGDIKAKLELARRYSEGIGIAKSDAKAFAVLQNVAAQWSENPARDVNGSRMAEAFRKLAGYYRAGVPSAAIKPSPADAFRLLFYSASYFGDPASQFELARMLIEGEGVPKNKRVAAQWLMNASLKGYAPAQAVLGNILWLGDGVKRVPGDGLALLAVAEHNASPEDRMWVTKLFQDALSKATQSDVLAANVFIMQDKVASHAKLTGGALISIPVSGAGQTNVASLKQARDESAELVTRFPDVQASLMPKPAADDKQPNATPISFDPAGRAQE